MATDIASRMHGTHQHGRIHPRAALNRAVALAAVLSLGALGACQTTAPSQTLKADFLGPDAATLQGVFVEAHQGDRVWVFTADDFDASVENQTPHTDRVVLDDARPIQVVAGLVTGSDTVALLSATLGARSDFNWFVGVSRGTDDPQGGCFNCLDGKSVQVEGAPAGERFWLVWGGDAEGAEPF